MFAFWNIACEGSYQIDESCVTRMLSLIQQITRLDNVTSVFSDFQITFCYLLQSFLSYCTQVGCFMNAVGLPLKLTLMSPWT